MTSVVVRGVMLAALHRVGHVDVEDADGDGRVDVDRVGAEASIDVGIDARAADELERVEIEGVAVRPERDVEVRLEVRELAAQHADLPRGGGGRL